MSGMLACTSHSPLIRIRPRAPACEPISFTSSSAVLSSLVIYASAYAFVFGAGIWYLQKLLRKGPVKQPPKDMAGGEKTPARPLSLPDEKIEGGA